MLIIEYDGLHHLRDRDQWMRDLIRREPLEREGWRVVVINSDALPQDPRGTLNRIREAMIDRGAQLPRSRVPAIWIRAVEPGRP